MCSVWSIYTVIYLTNKMCKRCTLIYMVYTPLTWVCVSKCLRVCVCILMYINFSERWWVWLWISYNKQQWGCVYTKQLPIFWSSRVATAVPTHSLFMSKIGQNCRHAMLGFSHSVFYTYGFSIWYGNVRTFILTNTHTHTHSSTYINDVYTLFYIRRYT